MRSALAPIAFAPNTWHSLLEWDYTELTDPSDPPPCDGFIIQASGGTSAGQWVNVGAVAYEPDQTQFQYADIGNDSAPYNCSLWPGVNFRVLAYQGSGAGEVFSAPSGSTSYSEGTVFQPPPDADGEQPLEVDAPSNLTTSLVDGQIQLNWDYSPSTDSGNQQAELGGFDVWAVNGVNARLIADDTDPNLGPDSTSYTLSPGSLLPGAGESYLVVTAQPVLDMEVPPYSEFSNAVALPAPNAPTGLTAVATSSSMIDVAWTDTNDGTASYQVQRMTIDSGTGGLVGSYQVVATIAPGETTQYVDTVADPLEYIYEVCAVNGASSAYATSLEVTPLPQAPSGVEAVVTSFSQVNVYWQANAVNATGEEVQWATDAGFENIVGTAVVGSEAEEYTVNNLVVGTTYYFRVWADNSSGESAIATASVSIANMTLSTTAMTADVNDQYLGNATVPGYLDGYDADGSTAFDGDDVGGNARFVELTATIPSWVNLATAQFSLNYSGTAPEQDPGDLIPSVTPTGLRAWDTDSGARTDADYITPNTAYDVTTFTDSAAGRTISLWVEALSVGTDSLSITLYPDGAGISPMVSPGTQPSPNSTQPATVAAVEAPVGQGWHIVRNGQAYAQAVSNGAGTIAGLAAEVGLNPDEFQNWLTVPGGSLMVAGPYGPFGVPVGELNTTAPIAADQVVEIPNTIGAFWAGNFAGLGALACGWNADLATFRKRGFLVNASNPAGRLNGQAFLMTMQGASANKSLQGFYYWGHGNKFGQFGTGGFFAAYPGWSYTWTDLAQLLDYHLGVVILDCCDGADNILDLDTQEPTNQTAKDLLTSPTGIFWGHLGLLNPFWPGSTTSVNKLLPPGAEGTSE